MMVQHALPMVMVIHLMRWCNAYNLYVEMVMVKSLMPFSGNDDGATRITCMWKWLW